MIEMTLKNLIYACLGGFLAFTVLVHAQSQSDFISIDCGRVPENTKYTDLKTGLDYASDFAFIDSEIGESKTISLEYYDDTLGEQFYRVRSFPTGKKNCYTLKPRQGKGTKYLIRARFLYGNYDRLEKVPEGFDLYIGANKWGSVKLDNVSSVTTKEIIYITPSDSIFLCLVNTGHGTPFISALELRPLKDFSYTEIQAAVLYRRLDIGSQDNKAIRYKDDVYDRIWEPFNFLERKVLSTELPIEASPYQIPYSVMATAMRETNSSDPYFSFHMKPEDPTDEYYVYMHFAEVEKLNANESREFFIYENGETWKGPISPKYLSTTTLFKVSPARGDRIDYELVQTNASTHPPIINALEAYIGLNFSQPQTHEQDVESMMKIKSKYGVPRKDWQGDPCAPRTYEWEGLNCSYDGEGSLRIISLNLSSSGLTGEISSHISALTMIRHLDLSNNYLTGSVPEFLAKLRFLKVLNLKGNRLTGSIPVDLIKSSNRGSLILSVSGNNPGLCLSLSCQKKKRNIVPIIASSIALFAFLVVFLIGCKLIRRRKQADKTKKQKFMTRIDSALEPKNNQFTYSEIIAITDNFKQVIGRGGFGMVYRGYIDDTRQVAVKMLSASSVQGYKEFQAEVKLLMRVHHINLTSLVGYCYEEPYMGLVYEYMANGNLGNHLSDKNSYALSWRDRLQISVDAAQGLEYLHHGCKPPIVHRDVKTANILLNEKFEAKLADFGLSRAFSTEGGSHISTAMAGTPGYFDPEYLKSNLLNEKSDVYSFGVVLLEIVTGRPVIMKANEDGSGNLHLSRWVESMLDKGEIKIIVDPRLQGDFHTNSAWKAVEVAIACVRGNSVERPRMNQVVFELNECLALEIDSNKYGRSQRKDSLFRMTTQNSDTSLNPSPR